MTNFWKWYKRREVEVLAISVAIIIIEFLILIIISNPAGKVVMLELVTPVAAITTAVFLFLAFRQSTLSNRLSKERIKYDYYMYIIDKAKTLGYSQHNLGRITDIPTFDTVTTQDHSLLKAGQIVYCALSDKDFLKRGSNRITIDMVIDFISDYVRFYESLSYTIRQIENERFIEENETDLLKRFSELLIDFTHFAKKFEGFETPGDLPELTNFLFTRTGHIKKIQTIYKRVEPYLRW